VAVRTAGTALEGSGVSAGDGLLAVRAGFLIVFRLRLPRPVAAMGAEALEASQKWGREPSNS
jgi:hypothetical protein